LSFDRAQYDVRSPVDGIVSNLRVNTLGGVVTPAQMLMDIVPKSLEYIVEAKVPTHLIGKITVGMPADLRFMAFDPRTTPVVLGEVTLVGADKVASDKVVESRPDSMRADFYLVRIAIRDDVGAKLQGKALQPGMPVDVIFKSGERPFLSYLLKPLSDELSKSFLN
jgi:protease secretion system membrane fusion protein